MSARVMLPGSRLRLKPPARPVAELTSSAFSKSRIRRLITTGLVLTLSATTVEQTGPLPPTRAITLNAWMATTNRLLDNIRYSELSHRLAVLHGQGNHLLTTTAAPLRNDPAQVRSHRHSGVPDPSRLFRVACILWPTRVCSSRRA